MSPAARRRTRLLAGTALSLGLLAVGAPAAADDLPSVSVVPAHADPDDPNGGQWFVLALQPGESGSTVAKITNPAPVPQRVVLYTRDLAFTDDGTPFVREDEQQDVGAWSDTGPTTLQLGPRESTLFELTITAPADADPGDHVGVLVAETSNEQQGFDVVRRVATRLYVTLPGTATRAMSIEGVTTRTDSRWFPGEVTTDVTLANVGRVRLRPTVRVGDEVAQGSELLLSRSVERYTATQDVPWYGGVLALPVQAVDDSGLSRTVDKKMIVVPWGLLLAAAAAALVGWRIRRWWRARASRLDGLQADLRRLERLLSAQALAAAGPPDFTDAAGDAPGEDSASDRVQDLFVAIKRAQRAGAHESLARLALELHAAGGPALPVLLDALGSVPDGQRAAVVAAIRSHDPQAVARQLHMSGFSPDVLGPDESAVPAPAADAAEGDPGEGAAMPPAPPAAPTPAPRPAEPAAARAAKSAPARAAKPAPSRADRGTPTRRRRPPAGAATPATPVVASTRAARPGVRTVRPRPTSGVAAPAADRVPEPRRPAGA